MNNPAPPSAAFASACSDRVIALTRAAPFQPLPYSTTLPA